MFYAGRHKKISRFVIVLTLSAALLIASSSPSQAQRRRAQRPVPAGSSNNVRTATTPYTLGGGDRIRIDILAVPEFSGDYSILADGTLFLPQIGSVSLQGLTLAQATQSIENRYRSVLKEPVIALRLLTPRPLNIWVSGEVNRPGSYTLSLKPGVGDNPGFNYPTLAQAIEAAKGITLAADISRVSIRRASTAGRAAIINVDLLSRLQNRAPSPEITLRDGDTIYIPTTSSLNPTQIRQLASSSLALSQDEPRTVAVLGEVSRPGSYAVLGSNTGVERRAGLPTLTRAIQLAGGVSPSADIRRIQIRRSTQTGRDINIDVNLWQYWQAGDLNQDVVLQDGDTIVIPATTTINLAEISQLALSNFATPLEQPRTVALVGEVTRPGSYVIIGGDTVVERRGGLPTITRAIQLAGGISPSADIRRIQIRRPTKTGPEQIININLWDFWHSGDLNQDTVLQEGDTIVIPATSTVNPAETSQLATASFAVPPDQPRTVAVLGEVSRPGAYVIIGGETGVERRGGLPTLTRAIQRAGGITANADVRNIQVRRTTRGGNEQIINVNLWKLLQAGDFSQDVVLQEGDTVFIPTAADINPAEVAQVASATFSPDTIQVSVVGEVRSPGSIKLPPNSTLNQALLAAGGFDSRRANRNSVELIRLNPTGTVSRRKVPIDFSEGIDEQKNPLLRNNDIIIIGRSRLARITDTLSPVVPGLEFINPTYNLFRIMEIIGIF